MKPEGEQAQPDDLLAEFAQAFEIEGQPPEAGDDGGTDTLTAADYLRADHHLEGELLRRAQTGEIDCPWCETPLSGEPYRYVIAGEEVKGVRLTCACCGFDER